MVLLILIADENMEYLDLSDHQLSEEIPHCSRYWQSLKVLKLANNNFSGTLPQLMHTKMPSSLKKKSNYLSVSGMDRSSTKSDYSES